MSAFDDAAGRVRDGADRLDEAAALVASMTIEERLGCLDGDVDAWPGLADLTSGGYHEHPWPAAAVPRLGVPGLAFADGPRGVVVGAATAFPVPMARGATFDPALEERIGDAIGLELRAAGATFYGGICVNLLRHPGWGRAQETYGEDPHHVGEMGAALCRGVQAHVPACVKHFACNSIENARFVVDVSVSDEALHEVYLPHFRRVVDEGVAAVMSAYNSVNGEWSGQSRALLTDVLRHEWAFDGIVITDFVFGLRDAVASIGNGLDVEMPFRQQRHHQLPGALADGRLDEADIDRLATRVVAWQLRWADALRGVDRPGTDAVAGDAHRALAREAAAASMVVLANDGTLPIDRERTTSIAVIGELATAGNLGDRGSSDVRPPSVVSILDGVRSRFAAAEVRHHHDDSTIASGADVAVVVVGCTWRDEGEYIDPQGTADLLTLLPPPPGRPQEASGSSPEPARRARRSQPRPFGTGGDRRRLGLSAAHERLVRETAATNPATVVVLVGGSAIVTSGWDAQVAAVVHAWYPGMEGGHALADVLSGVVNPSGHLPFAVPVDEADLVDFDPDTTAITYGPRHGQWWLDHRGTAAAHPFGWGLSYTEFELGDLEVDVDRTERVIHACVTIANTGGRDGSDVTFLFAGPADAPPGRSRPARRLVSFSRTSVAAGEHRRIDLDVAIDRLAVRSSGDWVVESGVWELTAARWWGDPAALSVRVEIS